MRTAGPTSSPRASREARSASCSEALPGDWMILETPRLTLRHLSEEDAPFMLALLNDEAFIRFIGDRNVRTLDEARAYIRNGAMASYATHGFGLYLVESKELGAPIGLCGVLKRDTL